MSHNNNPELSNLLACSIQSWRDLHSSAVMTRLLQMANVPLVNVLNLVDTVASTRNCKFRSKYISQLITVLKSFDRAHHKVHLVHAVTELLQAIDSKYALPKVTKDDVSVWTCDNSPNYIAYLVGDSKHWASCLRSGIQRALAKDDTYLIDWTTDNGIVNALRFGKEYKGCNASYLETEYYEFKAGNLMYLTVGKFCNEDIGGPRARARVYLGSYDGKVIAIIDRVYHTQDDEVCAIYNKLNEMYEGRTYTMVDSELLKVGNDYALKSLNVNTELYSDYTRAHEIVSTSQRAVSKVALMKRRGSQPYISISDTGSTSQTITHRTFTRLSRSDYYTCAYSYSRMGDVHSEELSVLLRLLKYTGRKFGKLSNPINLPDDSKLTLSKLDVLRWTYRGCDYKLHKNLELVRRGRTGKWYTYEPRTGKWRRMTTIFDEEGKYNYSITRHNVHLIYKFLPHGTN